LSGIAVLEESHGEFNGTGLTISGCKEGNLVQLNNILGGLTTTKRNFSYPKGGNEWYGTHGFH